MAQLWWLALAVVGAGACGGAATQAPEAPLAPEQKVAATHARDLVNEAYAMIRRGGADGMQTLVAEDVVVFGPGAGQGPLSRSDAVVALASALEHRRARVTSRSLRVAPSPAGRAALAVDRVDVDGKEHHLTAILEDRDELWVVVAAMLSRAGQGPTAPAASPPAVGPGAQAVAELFMRAAASPPLFAEQLADSADATAVGPRELTRGAPGIKRRWKSALPALGKLEIVTLRAALCGDGSLGWVVADARTAAGAPRRFFAVYARAAESWRLLSLHESAPR